MKITYRSQTLKRLERFCELELDEALSLLDLHNPGQISGDLKFGGHGRRNVGGFRDTNGIEEEDVLATHSVIVDFNGYRVPIGTS